MDDTPKIPTHWLMRIAKVVVIVIVVVGLLYWGIMWVTNGGTLFRNDEAKAACYALVSQKYPNARVLNYDTTRRNFGEIIVTSDLRAPNPDNVLAGNVNITYECLVDFRTGFPQARLTRLDVLD
jgi:hypothetical protein